MQIYQRGVGGYSEQLNANISAGGEGYSEQLNANIFEEGGS